ncbi:MAG: exodeoxyribonuclease V subunit beta [Deltaproteobacteria bacterium]|nr:exodeoxyribonuclease V subunit beta [Deltaproteobacteria bacterium]
MTAFDLLTCPLAGINLIEASAGTGKTHALAGLYLRFLIEERLAARQILVITYTNAATADLKQRIRQMIVGAERAFRTGESADHILRDLLKKYSAVQDRKRILRDLGMILANFDETAIFTIHGFCQRILTDHAFASGELFEVEFIENQRRLEQEFIDDFWRRHFYKNHPVIVQYALAGNTDRNTLLPLLRTALSRPDLKIIPDYEPFRMDKFERDLETLRETFSRFKSVYLSGKSAMNSALRDKALNGQIYGRKVDALIREIEALADLDELPLPPPVCLQKISADYLQKKTNKDQKTPKHAAFDLSQEMLEASARVEEHLDRYLAGMKKDFMEAARVDFPGLKRKKNVLYFDDLLSRAYDALQSSGGSRLAEILRAQYRAVLVDEFQDTDPIQFAILQSLFFRDAAGTDPTRLFYIGDPKQAIYSFRGADIFAYLRAARNVDHRYSMQYNWRSEETLINAVNVLFGEPERSFVYDEIPYHRIRQAPDIQVKRLRIAGEESVGVEWWFVPGDDEGRPLGVGAARRWINEAVVAEIARLLKLGREQKAYIGEKTLDENDIAVLVRRNEEANALQKMLNAAGIPSVIYSAESVYSSNEARELQRLMLGIIHYENEGYVLSALTTVFFNVQAADIAACTEEDSRMEGWRTKFKYYNELWKTKGFLSMFAIFLEQEDARPGIAALPDGERRLTNFAHLAQELFRSQSAGNLRPTELLRWFNEMMVTEENVQDDQLLQLETDRHCVRLVTIHRSKGLQYPIVFCPFAWEMGSKRGEDLPVCFHDEQNNWQATADLGSEDISENRMHYDREVLAEDCRLLYVAMTRAQNRCYFVSGYIKGAQSGAVTYLFQRPLWMDQGLTLTDADRMQQLMSFSARAPRDISIKRLTEIIPPEKWLPESSTEKISYQEFKGKIEQRGRIASYTYLTHASHEDLDWEEGAGAAGGEPGIEKNKAADNLQLFPPGATSGILLHEIIEKIDFQRIHESETAQIVGETLGKFNYALSWQSGIMKMLERLARTKLRDRNGSHFSLSEIDHTRCRKELEFYFPLQEIHPEKLMSLLETPAPDRESGGQRKLNFLPVQGFLKGFIDFIFEYGGQFYLADWKSNDLGDQEGCYTPPILRQEIFKHFYDVQYLIYTVALDRYLQERLTGYLYEKNFGGVFYFFLRGLSSSAGPEDGVYYHRPDEEVIRRLANTLLAENSDQ